MRCRPRGKRASGRQRVTGASAPTKAMCLEPSNKRPDIDARRVDK
jgi:hypothetical protein